MTSNSISRKFQRTILFVTFSAMILFAIISVYVKYTDFYSECNLITETYLKDQEQIFKYEVERAIIEVEWILQTSDLSIDQIESLIINQLREIRFPNKGNDLGFFFIKSYDGIQKLSVSKPQLEETDVSKYEDPNGIFTHEVFMNIINEKGSGFTDYSWYNPYTDKDQKKRSYIKAIPAFEWYIGAGFWFKDINSIIEGKRAELHKEVKMHILLLIIIIVLFYFIIYLISKNISNKIKNNFVKISLFFKDAAMHHAKIEKNDLYYKEFEDLATSANTMISERIKADEDVKIMAHALTSISDCVSITDLQNKLISVNDAFLKTYGYETDELIGKDISIVGSSKNTIGLHDDIIKETILGGWNGDFWNTRKDGTDFQINLSTSVVRDFNNEVVALVAVARDITQQKRNELLKRIIYNIAQAANIAEGLDDLIETIKDQLQLIIDVKNFYVAFYNEEDDTFTSPYTLDENDDLSSWPAGKSCTAYVYRSQKPKLFTKGEMKRLEKLGKIEFIGEAAEVWLGVPLKIKGKTYGVFAIQNYDSVDAYTEKDLEVLEFVSHQMSISIERKKVEDELYKAYEKAKESDRLKSAFLATMSHELRTPLNAVIGFSELINEELTTDKLILYKETINKSGKHLLEIIEDIFDVTLLEVGQVHLNKKEYSISTIMQSVNEMISAKNYGHSDVEIIYNNDIETEDIQIYTDKGKLTQIIINLLKNALKFTKEGFVEYGFQKISKEENSIGFYVKDTGIGIAKEDQETVFDIFRQADDSLTRNYEGTGIGLFVVKKYAEILGGKVDVESEQGKGSTFYVTLPIVVKKDNKETIVNFENNDSHIYSDKTVLIVEDDEFGVRLLEEFLSINKIKYLIARNGKEAVNICEKNKNIDLVLMDIKMPEMDGIEATKRIKKQNPELKIIAQTAHAIHGDKEDVMKYGCDGYISKPIMQDELNNILQKYLSNN